MLNASNLFAEIQHRGIPYDHHESDLYIPANSETAAILKDYLHKECIRTFTSQTDKQLWYDVPFAFTPWWKQRTTKEVQ